jgi:hypothetical protein
MKILFINATDTRIYSNNEIAESIKNDTLLISKTLPNSVSFGNYTEAYKYFQLNFDSFSHIVTGCTPEKGLNYFDIIDEPKSQFYMKEYFPNEMESWLHTYISSFEHLTKFRQISNKIKFIIYSGYSQEKPKGAFDKCLLHFIGSYSYVAKTNNIQNDISQLLSNLNISESNEDLSYKKETQNNLITSIIAERNEVKIDNIILDRPMHKVYFDVLMPYLRNKNRILHISFLCGRNIGAHFIRNLEEYGITYDFMNIPEEEWAKYKVLPNYKGK